MRRVAVTGLGAVTPLGNDAPSTWRAAVAGESGIDFIKSFDASEFPVRVAAEVKDFDAGGLVVAEGGAPARPQRPARARRRSRGEGGRGPERLRPGPRRRRLRLGDRRLPRDHGAERHPRRAGPDRVSPYFIPSVLVDSASGQIAISLGMRGPNYAPVSACATGSHAVGEGAEIIRRGDADVDPRRRHRGLHAPADPGRLLRDARARRRGRASAARLAALRRHASGVRDGRRRLRSRSRGPRCGAQTRGAKVYAEVLGYGASNDAYHMAAPDPAFVGVAEMMRSALARARVDPSDVDYVNAHGTSTPLGDLAETKALKDVFGDHAYELAVSSTKSMMGHCFGAAGAIEAMMCVLAIHEGDDSAHDQLRAPRSRVRSRLRPERGARGEGRRRALERDGPRRPQRLRVARPRRRIASLSGRDGLHRQRSRSRSTRQSTRRS